MKLEGKKELVSRVLNVGKARIVFNTERLSDIKEAITKQDVRDLVADKAIVIKEVSGRRTITKRKTRRRAGSIKKKVKKSKEEYMAITRKLRSYLAKLKEHGKISQEDFVKLRKQIRARDFRNLPHMKERITMLEAKK